MAPIDLGRLRAFSDGTPAGLQQLCGMFLEHMREAADILRPAAAGRNADVLQAEAHKAAGTAGACGAQRLSELLTAMELLAAGGQLDEAAALMHDIDKEVTLVRQAVQASLELPR
jgi:HPt (histidine-containing phosphotransfer) domain-containing protein